MTRAGPGPAAVRRGGEVAATARRRGRPPVQPAIPGADARAIAAFLEAQAAEAGAARNTLLAYGRDLRDLAAWLAARGGALATLGTAQIEAYLAAIDAAGLSRATRARRLSAIRQYARFALSEGWRDTDPAIRLRGPGRAARLPRTLAPAEVAALLAAAAARPGPPADRARAVCLTELLYATGLRVSELVTLPVTAARGDPAALVVRGKGGKDRLVPLTGPARAALAAWLAVRDDAPEGSALARLCRGRGARWLFPAASDTGHLPRQAVGTLLAGLAAGAGIDPARVSPHVLRHAFATHLLDGGADLRAIQTLLGHADLGSTEIYTHVQDARKRALVLQHHPLATAKAP